jgi:hypothetical protein
MIDLRMVVQFEWLVGSPFRSASATHAGAALVRILLAGVQIR